MNLLQINQFYRRYKSIRTVWLLLVLVMLLFLPAGLTPAEETLPPETSRSVDGFRYPSAEDNLDLTRGMMYMAGLMVLIVVSGTLRILQLDRVNRPHLLKPKTKRHLPDATIKKPVADIQPQEHES